MEARKTISQELNIHGSYMNNTVSETYDLAKLTHWTSFKAYIWKLGEPYPKSYIFTKPLNKKHSFRNIRSCQTNSLEVIQAIYMWKLG